MERSRRQLERVVKGFANHRRIQVLEVLEARPDLDLTTITRVCGINFKTASEHVRRLSIAGLVWKKARGRNVLHAISPRGKSVLRFLSTLG